MTSCLGIYIEPNFIKYAKISKDHDILRVESFGIKFYDKLGDAIDQVISDTYSFKTPISINLSEESYQYFYMFTLLNKVDMKKAIQTEFESFCSDKGINKNGVEARYVLVNSLDDKEKIKVIHVSANKSSILEQEQPFLNYKLSTIAPVSISISNIANLKSKENALIINMENETTITTVIDQRIYQVEKIQNGASEVLEGIRIKENSYSKAYEICKNSTIYTMEGQELQEDKNEYLDDIMPTLYTIASKVKEIIENIQKEVDIIIIDFHAEATAEKIALGYYLDGKVTAVYGTHTHVQTADETILERGTAYITDIGMTGPKKSVIGMDVLASIKRFETTLPERYKIATGECIFNGVIFEVNDKTNKVINIKRVKI